MSYVIFWESCETGTHPVIFRKAIVFIKETLPIHGNTTGSTQAKSLPIMQARYKEGDGLFLSAIYPD